MQSINGKSRYEIRYLVVPDYVFNNRNLNPLARDVYCFIHGYKSEHFFFSNEKLAELFKCHEMSVSRAIALLVKEGYIATEQPNGRKRYIIDLWVNQNAYPGSTKTLTHVEADGSTKTLTHNSPNPQQNKAKDEDFGVSNKNIINNNTLANFENTDETDETSEEVEIPNNLDSILPLKREKKLKVIPGWGKPNPRPALTPLPQRQQDYKLKERGGVDATDII